MSNYNVTDKNTGDSFSAAEHNALKVAVNTKADTSDIFPSQQSQTTGTSYTITNNNAPIISLTVNPSSKLSSDIITLPSSPSNGQTVTIRFGGTITSGTVVESLTIQPNASQGLLQATTPMSAESGEMISYEWKASNSKWYRNN